MSSKIGVVGPLWLAITAATAGAVVTVLSSRYWYKALPRPPSLATAEKRRNNALNRPARSADGRDVVIRVVCVASQGQSHLQVLQYLSRGLCSQATPNHSIPLFELFEFEDIIFGVFPRIGTTMLDAYDSWPENSVGDIIDMIMQCLEGLGYMHSIGVAHRDAFKDNFLVEWFPESMAEHQLTISRPRVYLNDFETAVYFPQDVPAHERICVGLPLSPSFPSEKRYSRTRAPELSSDQPYDPFKLDVWQFGFSLRNLRTTIPEIDSVLGSMLEEDPRSRISAFTALKSISQVVHATTPESLRIPPVVVYQ
ncbi:kinase-like domain-containing protein [Trametes meyenii]|nr:kinase-like domain-containing protein [Trametes meyenii]